MRISILKKAFLPNAVAILLAVAAAGSPIAAVAGAGTFTETGGLVAGVDSPMATVMANGKVLVSGGENATGQGVGSVNSAEVYDPVTGTFTPTGAMWSSRTFGTSTLLPNGKVLVAGGIYADVVTNSTAELYDPATGLFSLTGSMTTGRGNDAAVLLPNGKVLLAGGTFYFAGVSPMCLASAELFDPATGSFTPTGEMSLERCDVTATLLQSGKVLVIGSEGTADLYDPATGAFTPSGNLNLARSGATLSQLNDGRVLIAGGTYAQTPSTPGYTATAEIYDPATGLFTMTGSMLGGGRTEATASTLPNGTVLIAGGLLANVTGSAEAELYNPTTGTFVQTGSLLEGRYAAAAVTLQNGQAMVLGGNDHGTHTTDAELFSMSDSAPVVAPTIAVAFSPTKVVVDGYAKLTITLKNPNAVAITNVNFADTYPSANTGTAQSPYIVSAIINADATVANTCGGTVSVNANATSGAYVRLASGTVPANGSCSLTVDVMGYALGGWSDPIGVVTSLNAWPNPGDKSAPGNSIGTLAVVARPVIKCQPINTCN